MASSAQKVRVLGLRAATKSLSRCAICRRASAAVISRSRLSVACFGVAVVRPWYIHVQANQRNNAPVFAGDENPSALARTTPPPVHATKRRVRGCDTSGDGHVVRISPDVASRSLETSDEDELRRLERGAVNVPKMQVSRLADRRRFSPRRELLVATRLTSNMGAGNSRSRGAIALCCIQSADGTADEQASDGAVGGSRAAFTYEL